MKISDSKKIKLLSLLCLTLLSIILLFVCFRLFIRITNIFIYFTGLITLFLSIIFMISFIIFIIFKILTNSNHFKRVDFNVNNVLDKALSVQFKFVLFLSFIDLIFLMVYFNH